MKFKIFLLTALFVLVGTAAEIDFRTLPERAFWVTKGSTIQLTGVPPVITDVGSRSTQICRMEFCTAAQNLSISEIDRYRKIQGQ